MLSANIKRHSVSFKTLHNEAWQPLPHHTTHNATIHEMPMRHMVDVVVGDRVNRQTGVNSVLGIPMGGVPRRGAPMGRGSMGLGGMRL